MVMMESTLDLKGKMKGGLGSALMRTFANGESFFQQHIEATRGDGDCLLSPTLPGAMQIVDCGPNQYIISDGAFVAASSTVDLKVRTQSIGNALFAQSGGFFVTETSGRGRWWCRASVRCRCWTSNRARTRSSTTRTWWLGQHAALRDLDHDRHQRRLPGQPDQQPDQRRRHGPALFGSRQGLRLFAQPHRLQSLDAVAGQVTGITSIGVSMSSQSAKRAEDLAGKEAGGALSRVTMGLGWDVPRAKGFFGFGGGKGRKRSTSTPRW
jgi:hypothetical protein